MILGRMRDRVTLQARTSTNTGGNVVDDFEPVPPVRVPASVESSTGERMERLFGSQVTPIATHVVTVRQWSEVSVGDRLLWHGRTEDRTLEIRGAAAIGGPMRRYLVLACEERDVA